MTEPTQALTVVRPGENTSIAARTPLLEPNSLGELQQLGTLMAQSGFFQDARGAAQACVKILAGREMGFPPIASMVGISIIDGKPATGANLIAAAMKRAGYTWTVQQRDAKGCKITVSFRGQVLGPSEFAEEDAKRAGLLGKKNWEKFPRSMYFARTITDAARTYAPEVLAGLPAYTAEEMGAEDTTEDGAAIAKGNTHEQQMDLAEQKIAELKAKAEPEPKKSSKKATVPLDEQIDPQLQAIWGRMTDKASIDRELSLLYDALADKIGEEPAQQVFGDTLARHGVDAWQKLGTLNKAKAFARDLFSVVNAAGDPKQRNDEITDDDVPLFDHAPDPYTGANSDGRNQSSDNYESRSQRPERVCRN